MHSIYFRKVIETRDSKLRASLRLCFQLARYFCSMLFTLGAEFVLRTRKETRLNYPTLLRSRKTETATQFGCVRVYRVPSSGK
jgi:hypothetical protein